MGKLKIKKITLEDSQNNSQNENFSDPIMTQKEMDDYLRWYEERKSK